MEKSCWSTQCRSYLKRGKVIEELTRTGSSKVENEHVHQAILVDGGTVRNGG